jgi:septal ring factor EnvC (AmiA/AmiB activator)
MRLYDIAAEYEQLLKMVEREELTEEMIADTLESIEAEFNVKALNCMNVIAELDKELAGFKVQIDRLKALEKQVESSRDNLAEYVKNSILATGKDSLNLGLFKLSIRAATKQLPAEIDQSIVPLDCYTIIPQEWRIDRRKLLAHCKINPIEGIELVDSKRSLTIK